MPSQSKYNPTVKSSKVLYCPADLYAWHCASVTKPVSKEKLRRLGVKERISKVRKTSQH